MNIPWDDIIELAIRLIQECIANSGQEVTVDSVQEVLKNPGPWVRLSVQRATRKGSGLSGRDWRQQKSAIMAKVYAEASAATKGRVQELLDEAIET